MIYQLINITASTFITQTKKKSDSLSGIFIAGISKATYSIMQERLSVVFAALEGCNTDTDFTIPSQNGTVFNKPQYSKLICTSSIRFLK